MTSKNSLLYLFSLLFILFASSCKDDEGDPEPEKKLEIPGTYSFANVSYSGQTQRLGMLAEIKSYLGTANTKGTGLDATRLKAMFANTSGAQFTGTYESSKRLADKVFGGTENLFHALIDSISSNSQSTKDGTAGTAGVVASKDGAKKYLLSATGVEYAQLIEKGIMGACFYYQATAVYTGSGKMDVDNEQVTEGKGTKMEHHWDEAFGYFGVPIDFPANTDGIAFWGSYCNKRDAILNSNAGLMNAFLKGRAAISAKDLATRDEAIKEVRNEWEMVVAGTAIHYLNSAMSNFDDAALRSHALSEAAAFIFSLNFNETKKVNTVQIGELFSLIGGAVTLDKMNFYTTSKANIQLAQEKLAGYYELGNKKDAL